MPLLVIVAVLLTQSPAEPATPAEAEVDAASRSAAAAERAAAAAERAAAAMEAMLERMAPAPPAAPAEPAAPAVPPAPGGAGWTGSVGLHLIALSGNSETLTVSTLGTASREWGPWKLGLKVTGAYGQTRVEDVAAAEVIALNALGQVRGDRKLTSVASVFLLGGAETDHVKSLEYRAFGEGGAAIAWVERKQGDDTVLMLRTDLGLRYAYDSRFQYYPTRAQLPDLTLVAPKLGLGFRYALNRNVALIEEAEVMTNVVGEARYLVNSLTRINARLTQSVAMNVGFELKHDSTPAEGKRPTDTILSVGVELAL
jgi:hypothetical protein